MCTASNRYDTCMQIPAMPATFTSGPGRDLEATTKDISQSSLKYFSLFYGPNDVKLCMWDQLRARSLRFIAAGSSPCAVLLLWDQRVCDSARSFTQFCYRHKMSRAATAELTKTVEAKRLCCSSFIFRQGKAKLRNLDQEIPRWLRNVVTDVAPHSISGEQTGKLRQGGWSFTAMSPLMDLDTKRPKRLFNFVII